jgi:hypothetical protein
LSPAPALIKKKNMRRRHENSARNIASRSKSRCDFYIEYGGGDGPVYVELKPRCQQIKRSGNKNVRWQGCPAKRLTIHLIRGHFDPA